MSPAPLAVFVLLLVTLPAVAGDPPPKDAHGEVGRLTPEHTNRDLPVACSADGKMAVTGNSFGDLSVWDVPKRKPVWAAEGWALSTQANLLTIGSGLADPRTVRGFTHGGAVTAVVALSGERFATAGTDGAVRVWKMAGERPVETVGPFRVELAPDRRQSVRLLAASEDGSKLAAATSGRRVIVWDLTSGAVVASHGLESMDKTLPPEIVYLTFAPDGKLLVGTRQRAQVFVLADGQMKARPVSLVPPKATTGRPVAAFSADSRSLIVGNGDGLMRWDTVTGQRAEFADGADSPVVGLAAVGKKRFVAAHQDGVVRVWDFGDEAKPLRHRVRPAGPVTIDRAAFSADGRVGLLVDRKGTVRVYDLPAD
jgi:WD40 repeat protein